MYGLPQDFDPGVIVGRYLAKISFGRGSLHLELSRVAAIGESNGKGVAMEKGSRLDIILFGSTLPP